MKTLSRREEMRRLGASFRSGKLRVGFVPTMGFLHDGHISLMEEAKKRTDIIVVSIFVNPLQFGPSEDLARYPRDPAGDAAKCRNAGVDYLFTPNVSEMIDEDPLVFAGMSKLTNVLCGVSRPGHFQGVATIVLKLLNVVQPSLLYLGAKDFQQTVVIGQMVRELFLPVKVIVRPTVREKDGLAMSSRNSYLFPEERKAATVLYRAMKLVEAKLKTGERSAELLKAIVLREIGNEPSARLDYAEIVNPATLEPLMRIEKEARLVLAVWIGKTRLIDNLSLKP
ncbi:MAG TPA: pantoate--beta-alanine ligase [Nitrospiria bacterium]|nr:pantoate--beta-alanine ligase [Nitrospiria bacterium]